MKKWLVFTAGLPALYMAALKGRRGSSSLSAFDGWLYAHRGLHQKPDAPENSLEAFRRAVSHGYGCELDVHLLSDGNLAVFHDDELKRMTGKGGVVESLIQAELGDYRLGESDQTIPTFRQVLDLIDGKVPLIIELKVHRGNHSELCERVFQELDKYRGPYCVESFDPRVVRWLKKNRPDVIRGQLTQNFIKDRAGLSLPSAFLATTLLTNVLTRPDFVACRFSDRKIPPVWISGKLLGIQPVAWTLRNKEDLEKAVKEGIWPIFEGFIPS